MKRGILFILAICSLFMNIEADENWNGLNDTSFVRDTIETDTVKYSSPFLLSSGENIRVTCFASDTTDAGFADDSIQYVWGFQTGHLCLDSSLEWDDRDTCWDDTITVDTMDVADFGTVTAAKILADGSYIRDWDKSADTLNCDGFAYQSRQFAPEWDVYIRFWARGMAGNAQGDPIIMGWEYNQRQYQGVRRQ